MLFLLCGQDNLTKINVCNSSPFFIVFYERKNFLITLGNNY